jgi:hypothetical protein
VWVGGWVGGGGDFGRAGYIMLYLSYIRAPGEAPLYSLATVWRKEGVPHELCACVRVCVCVKSQFTIRI